MKESVTGNIFDIQRYTLHDGPGIRTEIFLQGCPLKCLWCHSPDSQSYTGQLAWFPVLCVGIAKCGECLNACPRGALTNGEKKYSKFVNEEIEIVNLDRKLCDDCQLCTQVCSPKALYFTAKKMSLKELMDIVEKDRIFYRRSNGGVTISGGEPMVQAEFATAIMKECKSRGIHTALDTSGCVEWEKYEQILNYVDLVLYDLKCMDAKQSVALIGMNNERILDNIQKIATAGVPLQIRVPVIPGINDSDTNLRATASFCASLGPSVHKVQLLPYHNLGISKYNRIGKKYQLSSINPPEKERMIDIKNHFENIGAEVVIG